MKKDFAVGDATALYSDCGHCEYGMLSVVTPLTREERIEARCGTLLSASCPLCGHREWAYRDRAVEGRREYLRSIEDGINAAEAFFFPASPLKGKALTAFRTAYKKVTSDEAKVVLLARLITAYRVFWGQKAVCA